MSDGDNNNGAPFSRHTFTVPTPTDRRRGPTEQAVKQSYADALSSVNANLRVEDGVQIWRVPASGKYRIVARGAQGGSGGRSGSGGYGAVLAGDFTLEQGADLYMLIGQEGRAHEGTMAGGGGGTFVFTEWNDEGLLLAAGGGGGYGVGAGDAFQNAAHANKDGPAGKDGVGRSKTYSRARGSYVRRVNGRAQGGTGGGGGEAASSRGCGGGGWSGNGDTAPSGATPNTGGGRAVLGGGNGYGGVGGDDSQHGSFGGGGAVNQQTSYGGCGGGGGYSGGGGAYSTSIDTEAAGGGGGSYLAETRLAPESRVEKYGGSGGGNRGEGSVTVMYVPSFEVGDTSVDHDYRQMQDKQMEITRNAQDVDAVNMRLIRQREEARQRDVGAYQRHLSQVGLKASTDFRDMVGMVGQLNEANAANLYISDSLSDEVTRVRRLDNIARNEVNKAQVRRVATHHGVRRYMYMTRVIAVTAVASAVLAMAAGGWLSGTLPSWAFTGAVILIALAYFGALAVTVSQGTRRRQNYWNQRYWPESARLSCEAKKARKNRTRE